MKLKTYDRICAVIFFSFGLFLLVSIPIYISARKTDILGSRFVPYVVAILMVSLSVLLFILTFISKKYKNDSEDKPISAANELRVFLFILTVIGSLFVMQFIGFLLATLIMVTFTLLLLKVRKISWFIIVYAFVVGLTFFFTKLVRVDLP